MNSTTPLETSPESGQAAEAAGTAGMLPPLKTGLYFRASDKTIKALAYIQERLNCDRTAAIELSIAWNAAHMQTDVYTPAPGEGKS